MHRQEGLIGIGNDKEMELPVIKKNKKQILDLMQVTTNNSSSGPKGMFPFEKPFTAKIFVKGPNGKTGIQSTGFNEHEVKTALWEILTSYKLTKVFMSDQSREYS
ncbi:hypothetical protein DRH27_01095 [Candidatus Falkowbacteria bacterium]|nr:MAG: hypothetical protein DRH27_01095 [Candidatus Falkowbacteria bacterium]